LTRTVRFCRTAGRRDSSLAQHSLILGDRAQTLLPATILRGNENRGGTARRTGAEKSKISWGGFLKCH
jgi:hypothetical protein